MTEACRTLLIREWDKVTKPILAILEGKDVPLVSEEPSNIRRYRYCRLCHYYNACKAKQPERQRWRICSRFKNKKYDF